MNRRRVLSAVGGLGLTAGSAWFLTRGGSSDGGSSGGGLPVRVRTVDAPGSEAGHARVPADGEVTVLDLFATWCTPCEKQMTALGTVHEEYAGRVSFVSVTNERIGGSLSVDDLRQWWRRHDGAWTLGVDPESDLMAALGVGNIPHLAVVDASGTVRWQESGVASADTLREHVDAALADA